MFKRIYQKLIQWSSHQRAPYYLAGISFIESSLFPIPPDFMLIPMVMAKPNHALKYALITTIFSILGGILGYAFGFYFFELIGQPLIAFFGYEQTYEQVVQWFQSYGMGAVIVAGFTPLPYKLFTLAAGVSKMPLIPFILASIIGRSARFFLVAFVILKYGKKIEPVVLKYIDRLGWLSLSLIGIGFCIYKLC